MRKVLILLLLISVGASALAQVDDSHRQIAIFGDLRIVNALVGIGPVDVYVNEQLLGSDLKPEQATPYLSLLPGRYSLAVYPVGADPLSVPIADLFLELPDGQSKTVIAYQTRFQQEGAIRQPDEDPNAILAQVGSMMALDDNRSPLQLGKTRLTAVHVAPGNPGDLNIAYPSRASLLHAVSLEIPHGDIDIDAGIYPLTIVDAASESLDRLAFIGEQGFNANMHYTLIMVPDLTYNPDTRRPQLSELTDRPHLFVISASIQPPDNGLQLRMIHAAPDTTIVDVYIDSQLVAPRLTYSQFTEYIGLPSFSHLIELRRRDAAPDSQPLATATFEISEDNRNQPHWTLLLLNGNDDEVAALELNQAQQPVAVNADAPQIFNTAGGQMMMALLPDNIAQTPRGQARVRLIHAIDGALEISLWASAFPRQSTDPTPVPNAPVPPPVRLVDPVIYGAEANDEDVPAGLYEELEFIAGSSTELIALENVRLLSGLVHTFVLVGLPSGEPAIQALAIADFGRGIPRERLFVGVVTSTAGVANIRRQPANTASVQDILDTGTEVEVLGRNFDGTWIKIRYDKPGTPVLQEGWIFRAIIRVTRLGESINALALPQVN